MKKLIALLILPLALFAATPVITIDDAGYCFIDGVNAGLAGDVIANHPQHAPAVNLAMRAYHAKVQADAADAAKAAQRNADAAIAKAQEEARATIKAAKDAAEKATKDATDAAEKATKDATDAIAAARNESRTAKEQAANADAARAKESARVAAIVDALKAASITSSHPVVVEAIKTEDAKRKADLQAKKAELEKQIAAIP